MEQIDPIRAQQVWNRVRGGEPPADVLPRLLALEQEAGQIYAQLAGFSVLSASRVLARLREECIQFIRIYQGMLALTDGGKAPPQPRNSLRGNPEGFLRRCWDLRQKSIALLDTGKFPPQLTVTAEQMKSRTEDHCLMILELLGWLRAKE